MAVTLRDVARRCGLSPSTVSDVLNNRTRTWASEDTRRRVFEAAQTLGYRPHSAARALRTGKTYVVAFIYHRDWSELPITFDGAAEILASRLGEQGYDLRLHVYPDMKHLMSGLDDMVRRKSCDAVVLFGPESDVAEQGVFLETSELPFIVKGRHEREHPLWYQVDYDHEGMMHAVVRHFAALGHRRIGYIGYDSGQVYQQRLREGFEQAVVETMGPDAFDPGLIVPSGGDLDAIARAIQTVLQLPPERRPTGFALGTGSHEWYIIEKILAEQGSSIGYGPGQLAVAGQADHAIHLPFGIGHYFADISHASIAQVTVDKLLIPLLNGEKPEPCVCRILPPLRPTPTLGLPVPTPQAR